jgi:O-antigen/teichoic acid export membrane protein
MATIRKQSIYSSIYIYAGFAIGAFNVLFLFPKFFTPEEFGLTRILMDITLILSMICTAGTIPVALKFFPFYKHYLPKEKNELFTLVLMIGTLMCVLLYFTFPFIEPIALRKFADRSPILSNHLRLVIPLTISLVALSILEIFAWIIGKTILANFLKEFMYRILVLMVILAWALGLIKDYPVFIEVYAYLYFIPVAILTWVIVRSQIFKLVFQKSAVTKKLSGAMVKYGGAYFLGNILNVVAKTNDTIIIASQSIGGLADAAIFTIATYLITVMDVPQRSMVSAAIPQIAQAWKDKDLAKLDRLYKKTALNLLVIAAGILGLVILNIPAFIHVLGPTYAGMSILMLILGISKLIDLGTGMNGHILQLSKHWKIDLFTNMFFVVISILLNYWLTRSYGIVGTAVGSLIAIILFNFIRFYYIKRIYGMQPFSWRNGVTLLVAGGLTFGLYSIAFHDFIWINLFVKSVLFILSFAFIVIHFNISPEITELYHMARSRVMRRRS